MTERTFATAALALLLAVVVGALLLVGAMTTQAEPRGELRPRFFFSDRPVPAARTIEQIEQRVPSGVRFAVPVQRQVTGAFRDAAGYLLLLLGVAAALVFARDAVLASYRASLGGWRPRLRVLLLGGALLALVMSATFLAFVVLLGTVAAPRAAPGPGPVPELGPLGAFLQVGLTGIGVAMVLVGLVALVGLAATSWRLGDAILSRGPLARIGQNAPATLVALVGASLIYLSAQIPGVGPIVTIGALAYAIGAVAAARLAPPAAATPSRAPL